MLLKRTAAYGTIAAAAAMMFFLFVQGLLASGTVHRGACMALQLVEEDRQAPDFTLSGLDGVKKSLADYKGKLVLLHFWATWCAPCLEELPSLYRMQRAITNDDFALLTVSVDDNPEIVKDFFARHGVPPLPVLMDTPRAIAKTYGTEKFPESYLIDTTGKVRYRIVNKRDWSSGPALACIRSLLH